MWSSWYLLLYWVYVTKRILFWIEELVYTIVSICVCAGVIVNSNCEHSKSSFLKVLEQLVTSHLTLFVAGPPRASLAPFTLPQGALPVIPEVPKSSRLDHAYLFDNETILFCVCGKVEGDAWTITNDCTYTHTHSATEWMYRRKRALYLRTESAKEKGGLYTYVKVRAALYPPVECDSIRFFRRKLFARLKGSRACAIIFWNTVTASGSVFEGRVCLFIIKILNNVDFPPSLSSAK